MKLLQAVISLQFQWLAGLLTAAVIFLINF